MVGSLIGAKILLNINPTILNPVIAILILIILPFVLFKKDMGVKHLETSKWKKTIGFVIYFFIMIFAGFFGQGYGVMIFYTLTFFLGMTILEIIATDIIPMFILAIASLIVFAINGLINYKIGIVLLIGMAIGGYLGAHLAIKKGNLWVKYLFVAFVIILGIKLLFF